MGKGLFAASRLKNLGNTNHKNPEAWETGGRRGVTCNALSCKWHQHRAPTTSSVIRVFMNSRSCNVLWMDVPGWWIQVSLTSLVEWNLWISSSFGSIEAQNSDSPSDGQYFQRSLPILQYQIFSLMFRPMAPALQIHRKAGLCSKDLTL